MVVVMVVVVVAVMVVVVVIRLIGVVVVGTQPLHVNSHTSPAAPHKRFAKINWHCFNEYLLRLVAQRDLGILVVVVMGVVVVVAMVVVVMVGGPTYSALTRPSIVGTSG